MRHPAAPLLLGFFFLLAACGPASAHDGPEEGEDPRGDGWALVEDGPVVLITGSTGGLGREVARDLASRGAHIIVHGRNVERGEGLVAEIEEEGRGSARFYRADLASLDQTRAFARQILDDYDRLDVLVNNAGVWADGPDARSLTDDGIEWAFQVNYLSHYVLTRKLLPLLQETARDGGGWGDAGVRIIHVASVAQRPIDFDDPMMDRGYSHGRSYSQSKLAQVIFSMDLARELEGTGVSTVALHPATMMDTDMVLSRGAEPRTSVDEGREAVVNLVTSPDVESGTYYNGLRPARANDQAYDREAQRLLRELSGELTGVR